MSPPRSSDELAALDERGQAFLHRARGLRGLAPHQVARIAQRLKERRPARRGRVLARAFATIALVLMVGAAAAWASGALTRWPGLRSLFGGSAPGASAQSTKTVAAAPPTPGAVPAFGAPPAASETAPAPDEQPPLAGSPEVPPLRAVHRDQQPAPRRPAGIRHRASVAAARQEKSPPDGTRDEATIVLEGRSLAAALELWRARGDVPAALAALDQHDRRFADGQMRVEAQALRAEILLAARREADALAVLDRLLLDQVPRGRELRTLRGELRVRLGRCDEGRSDLASISRGADALATRARAALARCP